VGKKSETKKQNRSRQSPVIRADREASAKTGNKSRILHNPVIHILFIFIIAFLAYADSFHAPFTFDDAINITDNPNIRNIGSLIEPWYSHKSFPYANRYIGMLTFALNYRLHGSDVAGYHIVNFCVHVINALLVYLLVLYTFRTPFLARSTLKDHAGVIAFFSGLFFVVHPLQTQAVTYIVQRLTSLATLFYLLSVVLYVKWRLAQQTAGHEEQGREKKTGNLKHFWFLFSIISAVLAMRTKEIAFTLPFIIALYEVLFFGGSMRKRMLYIIPILITMVIIPLTLLHYHTHELFGDFIGNLNKATRVQTSIPRLDYLLTEFRVIVTYLRLFVFPINQNLDYEYPIYHSLFNPQVFLSLLLLLCIGSLATYLLFRDRNKSVHARIISFGIFWFFITLSVESSIVPIIDVIYEHRMYLPSVGLCIAATGGLFWATDTMKGRWAAIEKVAAGVLVSLAVILAGMTYMRNQVWQDRISLWEDVVRKSPAKTRPHYNLGTVYLEKSFTAGPAAQDRTAAGSESGNAPQHDNEYIRSVYVDKAIEQFRIALKLDPKHAGALNNLGNAYMTKGIFDKAIEYYQAALELNPDNADAIGNMGNIYLHRGLTDKAIDRYLTVVKLKPDNPDIHFNLGIAYLKRQENSNALREFQTALQLNPALHEARNYIDALSRKGSGRK
jgi:protein O-mannosyl-transferase